MSVINSKFFKVFENDVIFFPNGDKLYVIVNIYMIRGGLIITAGCNNHYCDY